MAVYEISNGIISISVESCGAELKSLRTVENEKEYFWQGDPEYWVRSSPTLFPITGALHEGEYRLDGAVYALPRHGFVKDKECSLVSQSDREIWFCLEADEETKAVYPYDFRLEIGYRLEGKTLQVLWRVNNRSESTMYFSIGGHPGFLCDVSKEASGDSCYIAFEGVNQLCNTIIEKDGLYGDRSCEYLLEQGMTPLAKELFAYDTLVLEDYQVKKVVLLTPDKKPILSVSLEAPVLAVWSPIKETAPFVCIEPWYGICDRSGYQGSFADRKWTNQVEAGGCFSAGYSITIEE